jgi:hypothetical protein
MSSLGYFNFIFSLKSATFTSLIYFKYKYLIFLNYYCKAKAIWELNFQSTDHSKIITLKATKYYGREEIS